VTSFGGKGVPKEPGCPDRPIFSPGATKGQLAKDCQKQKGDSMLEMVGQRAFNLFCKLLPRCAKQVPGIGREQHPAQARQVNQGQGLPETMGC
jgi:hypothetical protein